MHIGGAHILTGLLYLLLIIVVIYWYVSIGYLVVMIFRWIFQRIKHKRTIGSRYFDPPKFVIKRDGVVLILLFIAVLCSSSSFYLRQRIEWTGDDNANFEAKEYFVAGQVLNIYRFAITEFIHPDNLILAPMHYFQEKIYNTGRQYLPENDGEVGIWMDRWFVNPYTKRFRLPKGYIPYSNNQQVAPMVVELLDKAWFAIETVATKPFADQQMYYQRYLTNFHNMAHYYTYHKGFYTGPHLGSAHKLNILPKHIKRSEKMLNWLEELNAHWQDLESMQAFLKKYPEVDVIRQVTFSMEATDLLMGRINTGDFSCSDPFWRKYQMVRSEFVDGVNGQSSLQRMPDREKAQLFENVVLHSVFGKFDWYVLREYCGIILPGEINFQEEITFTYGKKTIIESLEYNLNSLFKREMTILEEQFNGNN